MLSAFTQSVSLPDHQGVSFTSVCSLVYRHDMMWFAYSMYRLHMDPTWSTSQALQCFVTTSTHPVLFPAVARRTADAADALFGFPVTACAQLEMFLRAYTMHFRAPGYTQTEEMARQWQERVDGDEVFLSKTAGQVTEAVTEGLQAGN